MSRLTIRLATLAVAAVCFGCSDDSDDGGAAGSAGTSGSEEPAGVSFATDIHPILQMKCGATSGCHNGDSAPTLPAHGAADVEEAYEATQAMSSTYPGELVYERISLRITDTEAMMPPNFANPPCNGVIGQGGCLTQAQVDLIREWIEQGTPP